MGLRFVTEPEVATGVTVVDGDTAAAPDHLPRIRGEHVDPLGPIAKPDLSRELWI
jgi:hypothetical protein